MADTVGWRPDPGPGRDPYADDRDRSWDEDADGGVNAWADDVGLDGLGSDFDRPPDHVPHLHRAMSEAAADLDAVEERLSTLFERTEDPGPDPSRRTTLPTEGTGAENGTTAVRAAADDDEILDFFEDAEADEADEADEVGEVDDDAFFAPPTSVTTTDRMAIIGEYEDDIGGDFAALDVELAAEEPDEPTAKGKRRKFGRRAKGTTAARR